MPLTRRYAPEWAPGDTSTIGMDFSALIPPGIGIVHIAFDSIGAVPRLEIWTNRAQPVFAGGWSDGMKAVASTGDFTLDTTIGEAGTGVIVVRRTVYAQVSGGLLGTDYQFRWIIMDTAGNRWMRTGLLLCSLTS